MLVPPTELIIIEKNQPAITVSTGIIQAPHALKTPAMHKLIGVTTPNNTGANSTQRRVNRSIIDGSNPSVSGS